MGAIQNYFNSLNECKSFTDLTRWRDIVVMLQSPYCLITILFKLLAFIQILRMAPLSRNPLWLLCSLVASCIWIWKVARVIVVVVTTIMILCFYSNRPCILTKLDQCNFAKKKVIHTCNLALRLLIIWIQLRFLNIREASCTLLKGWPDIFYTVSEFS